MINILTIAQLTILEGRRRLIVRMAVVMGFAFLALFALGLHLIFNQIEAAQNFRPEDFAIGGNILTMVGLYVTNFLVVIMAVLISVASVSNEIDTRVIDTLVTKPIERSSIILGKWLGFAVMITLYVLLLSGGVILIAYLRVDYTTTNTLAGLAVMCLNAIIVMTVTIAGGTRLSTLANGVLAFMLYGLAFIGGWVESIGTLLRNETAVNLGIISSLIMPIEALWKKAALLFQPQLMGDPRFSGPFIVTSEPSDAMIVYSVGYIIVLLALGLWSFKRRDL